MKPKFEKLSAAIKKRWEDPELREKYSKIMEKRWTDPIYKEFMSNMSKETWKINKPVMKALVQEAVAKKWSDPEHYASHTAVSARSDVKEKQREGHRRQWAKLTEEELNKIKEKRKELWKDPERRKKRSEKSKEQWTSERKELQKSISLHSNHIRWHVNRGIKKPKCELCASQK